MGEIYYPIDFYLLALLGIAQEEIKPLMSHPLALSHKNVLTQTTDDMEGTIKFIFHGAGCVTRMP